MEGEQQKMKKKNMTVKIVGGGGPGGIILLGGALATAALVSTIAFRIRQQNKSKPKSTISKKNNQIDSSNKSKLKEDVDLVGDQGLSFLVQNDSSSPLTHHHLPSNERAEVQNEMDFSQDDISQHETFGGKKEVVLSRKPRESSQSDESDIGVEEVQSLVLDSSLVMTPGEVKRENESLEGVESVKVDEEIEAAHSSQSAVVNNDLKPPLDIEEKDEVSDGNGKIISGSSEEQVLAVQSDQLGVDGNECLLVEECDGSVEIIMREELVEEAAHVDQIGVDDILPHKSEEGCCNGVIMVEKCEELVEANGMKFGVDDNKDNPGEECDGNGEIIVGKSEELVEAAQVDQNGVDDNQHMVGEECDDSEEITVGKREELVKAVVHVAKGINLIEERESTVNGDQEYVWSDSLVMDKNELESCDLNSADILLPMIESSSLSKPGDEQFVEAEQMMERGEANNETVQEDHIAVEGRSKNHLNETDENEEESHEVDGGNTTVECDKDHAAIESDQQMHLSEDQEALINGNQDELNSDKLSPESNSFLTTSVKLREISIPLLGIQSISKSENLNKNDSTETAADIEVDHIMVENYPLKQSSEKDHMENCDGGCNSFVAQEEEAVETIQLDFVQVDDELQTQIGEEEADKDGNKTGEEIGDQIVQTENFKINNHPQTQLKEEEDSSNDSFAIESGDEAIRTDQRNILEVESNLQAQLSEEEEEEEENDDEDGKENDEEDNAERIEESSETTGDSSQESNAEAIWPAESVQELSRKMKEMQKVNTEEWNCQNGYVKANSHETEDNKKSIFTMATTKKKLTTETTLKQSTNTFSLNFWILSLLVPFLLLLWLNFPESSFLHFSS